MARSSGGGRFIRVLLILVGLVLLVVGYFALSMPKADGPRVEAKLNVIGVTSPDPFVWILRTKNGAALIDTGLDPEGKAILAELRAQNLTADQVHTVLITHGHLDHTSAAILFKNAKVYAGKKDLPLIRGEEQAGFLSSLMSKFVGPRPMPSEITGLEGGETLDVDGEQLTVIATPGHTPGSVMYLYGELLFTGDSLTGGKQLSLAPSVFSKDPDENRRSLEQLKSLPFTLIADGHTGATANAREKLKRFLAK